MISKDYIQQALYTESNDWPKIRERYENTHALGLLFDTMNKAVGKMGTFDVLKRFFYYGKGVIPGAVMVPLEWSDHPGLRDRLKNEKTLRLLHAVIGLSTEIGELIEAVVSHVFDGDELDVVNVIEECGDLDWYFAMLHHVLGLDPEEVMAKNIAKLRKRYPQKFEAEQALNRDLEAERKVLEQDLVLYGNAFKDSEGRRVDPLQVQVHGPLICSVCGEVQVSSRAYRKTPSGWVCKNGHGGAPSMGEAE